LETAMLRRRKDHEKSGRAGGTTGFFEGCPLNGGLAYRPA
jgi:hypothetical protein